MEPHLTHKQRFQIYLRYSVDMSLIAGIQLSPIAPTLYLCLLILSSTTFSF